MAKKKSAKLQLTKNNILTCALYVIIGVLLCAMRMGSLKILFTIIGALFIVYGVIDVVNKQLTKGVVEAAVGAVVIIFGFTITQWVIIIFGALLIIKSVIDLLEYIQYKRKDTAALVGILVNIAVGVILCIAPFALGDIICIIAGVIFILNGVLALFGKKLK